MVGKVEEVEQEIIRLEDAHEARKANSMRQKLCFIMSMENRAKPQSDGPYIPNAADRLQEII